MIVQLQTSDDLARRYIATHSVLDVDIDHTRRMGGRCCSHYMQLVGVQRKQAAAAAAVAGVEMLGVTCGKLCSNK